jgi:hypothetical protein
MVVFGSRAVVAQKLAIVSKGREARLGFYREQLAEVFVELTDRIRISTE